MDHLIMVRANIESLKEKFANSSSPEYRNTKQYNDYVFNIFNYYKNNDINTALYEKVDDKYNTEKCYKSFNEICI